ncbi:MAG: rhodanese-like domain-containing protein [Acidimicrobiales bacterium]
MVYEHADDTVPYGVLTGDTLFIGDVGRPDLLASIGFTRDELADKLYDSLHTKLLPSPMPPGCSPATAPARRAARTCRPRPSRRSANSEATTTRCSLPTRRPSSISSPRASHRHGLLRLRRHPQPQGTSAARRDLDADGADAGRGREQGRPRRLLLDGRDPEEFARGHLAGSINVGLNGRYAEFAGSVVPSDADIVLVVDEGFEIEARNRLARIGFDKVVGYLAQPLRVMVENPGMVEQASRLTRSEYEERAAALDNLQIVDVRNPGEHALGSLAGATLIPVGQVPSMVDQLDPNRPTVVFCAGGYRSSVAASVLRQAGFSDVSDIIGGYSAWLPAEANA